MTINVILSHSNQRQNKNYDFLCTKQRSAIFKYELVSFQQNTHDVVKMESECRAYAIESKKHMLLFFDFVCMCVHILHVLRCSTIFFFIVLAGQLPLNDVYVAIYTLKTHIHSGYGTNALCSGVQNISMSMSTLNIEFERAYEKLCNASLQTSLL